MRNVTRLTRAVVALVVTSTLPSAENNASITATASVQTADQCRWGAAG